MPIPEYVLVALFALSIVILLTLVCGHEQEFDADDSTDIHHTNTISERLKKKNLKGKRRCVRDTSPLARKHIEQENEILSKFPETL
jgi:hypothetical protein